jgi:hypothetical protein
MTPVPAGYPLRNNYAEKEIQKFVQWRPECSTGSRNLYSIFAYSCWPSDRKVWSISFRGAIYTSVCAIF